ncbi:hypothetical protein L5515_019563 [Caenorhabditis briggsae]|uniref:Uncharacterized protein n=1 Tax=Caenorhabditis briggsae TaxID=6238 RepID=A0AAE9JTX8_CAEBR|nr:hypothetical protein L5515_019563 [Caenorhabditis briggsae]
MRFLTLLISLLAILGMSLASSRRSGISQDYNDDFLASPMFKRHAGDYNCTMTLLGHLDDVMDVMKTDRVKLPALVVNGTEMDFYFYSKDTVKTVRAAKGLSAKMLSAKGKKYIMEGIAIFTESSEHMTNSYLTKMILEKEATSVSGLKITKIVKCTDAQCDKPEKLI